jgi:hypothetical protein
MQKPKHVKKELADTTRSTGKLMNLPEPYKKMLRKLVKFTCEQCQKNEAEVGKLQPHRIKRGNIGGEYTLRNLKMICNNCHNLFHYDEPGIIK